MSGEIVVHQPEVVDAVEIGAVSGSTPKALIANAVAAANELAEIIASRNLFSNIQGKRYVRCEGWTTLAAIMGCLPREVEVTEKDGTYVAVVELHRIRDDALMGRASAECGIAEPTWKSRAPYARRSMAVTRATSKACRIAFSWVMTLAGFEVTPAEEMQDVARGAGQAIATPVASGERTAESGEPVRGSFESSRPSPPAPAPSSKGGIDPKKKAKLSQKNIDKLLTEAGGDDTLLLTVARIALHQPGDAHGAPVPASVNAEDWPAMDANTYDQILKTVRARLAEEGGKHPEAIQIEDAIDELERLMADTSKDAKKRIRVLGEFESARDRDVLTLDMLAAWTAELK